MPSALPGRLTSTLSAQRFSSDTTDGAAEGSREWLNTAWQAARKRAQAALFVHRAATWDSIGSDAPVITRDQDELRVLREAMVGHPDVVALARAGVPEVSLVAVSVLREQLDDVETSLVARARDDGVLAPYRPAARATAARRSGRRTLRRTSRRWTRPRTTWRHAPGRPGRRLATISIPRRRAADPHETSGDLATAFLAIGLPCHRSVGALGVAEVGHRPVADR